MNDKDLLYITTIAEEKTMSDAAKKLFITQPSLSQSLKKIEEKIGVPLFTRTPKGMVLTHAGECFYQKAREILAMYNDLGESLNDLSNLTRGRVILGIVNNLGAHLLPILLPQYRRLYPNIELIIKESNSVGLEEALQEGKIDLAIMHKPVILQVNGLTYIELERDPFVLATPMSHSLGQKALNRGDIYPYIDLKLFRDESFLMLREDRRIRQVQDQILCQAQIAPVQAIESGNFETIRRLVSCGMGVSLLPVGYIGIYGDAYPCDYYTISQAYGNYWDTCVTYSHRAYQSKAIQAMLQVIKNHYS